MKKQKVLVVLIGIVACLTFLGPLTPRGSYAIEYRLEDFVILVDDQLIIDFGDVVPCQGGIGTGGIPRKSDIGSRCYEELGGRGLTRIPVGAPAVTSPPLACPDDTAAIARNLKLGNFSQVSHLIYDTLTDVCTTGCKRPAGYPAAGPFNEGPGKMCLNSRNDTGAIGDTDCLPDFPGFPTFSFATTGTDFICANTDPQPCTVPAGTRDITVGSTATVNIPPGTYRDLKYGSFSKIHFAFGADGIYNFRRIYSTTNSAGNYQFIFEDEGIQIRVKQFVRFTEFGQINPTSANGVTMYVEGCDNSYEGTNKNHLGVVRPGPCGLLPTGCTAGQFPAAFEYVGDGIFNLCFVFVKNGTINLSGSSHGPNFLPYWPVQWFGNSLQEVTRQIRFGHPGENCVTESKECACISDFKILTTGPDAGKIRVNGSNFKKETLERLAIFSENFSSAPLILKDLDGGDLGKDQVFSQLDIISLTEFRTKLTVTAIGLVPGQKYLLGIFAPPAGTPASYCIFTEKLLEP